MMKKRGSKVSHAVKKTEQETAWEWGCCVGTTSNYQGASTWKVAPLTLAITVQLPMATTQWT